MTYPASRTMRNKKSTNIFSVVVQRPPLITGGMGEFEGKKFMQLGEDPYRYKVNGFTLLTLLLACDREKI